MNEAKQKKFLITVAYYGVIVVCVYLAVKFLLPPLVPFLIGFLFAWIIRKPARAIARKLHIKARIPALLLTAIFYICAAAVILFAGVQVVSALKDVLPRLPQIFSEQLMPLISNAFNDLKTWLAQFDPTVAANMGSWFSEFSTTLEQTISSLSSTALRLLSSLISGIPSMILKIVLTVVSTFFISVDFDRIIAFFKRTLSEKQWNTLYQAKVKAVNSGKVFFKSYVLIFLISFAELAVGFLIMRIRCWFSPPMSKTLQNRCESNPV